MTIYHVSIRGYHADHDTNYHRLCGADIDTSLPAQVKRNAVLSLASGMSEIDRMLVTGVAELTHNGSGSWFYVLEDGIALQKALDNPFQKNGTKSAAADKSLPESEQAIDVRVSMQQALYEVIEAFEGRAMSSSAARETKILLNERVSKAIAMMRAAGISDDDIIANLSLSAAQFAAYTAEPELESVPAPAPAKK